MHYPESHTESTKEVVILLTPASSVSGADPRSKASMYFVHKVATQGQFRTALAYAFRMTDATWTYINITKFHLIQEHDNKFKYMFSDLCPHDQQDLMPYVPHAKGHAG